ncbi:MAG TPA: primosomal protein N' [Nitrospinota bacterium]|nr:primosomal protein N' [Nitrospinota bacterium]|tara:strand:- start:3265 stop:5481 length:2217 start_codon:yes stop_codon:yes gene_type:complete
MNFEFKRRRFANVIAPRPLRSIFTYSIPLSMIDIAVPGKRVLVPFGAKKVIGLIAELSNVANVKTKDIEQVLDEEPVLPDKLLKLALWISKYYFSPPGDVMPLVLPKDDLILDTVLNITSARPLKTRSPIAKEIYKGLQIKGGSRKLSLLASDLSLAPTEVKKVLANRALKGFVEEVQTGRFRRRKTVMSDNSVKQDAIPAKLTPEQGTIAREVGDYIGSGRFQTFLLKGVTGSGKTEIYADLARRALEHGRSTLALAPEIELAILIARRLSKRLGVEVFLLHSGMTPAQRSIVWDNIRQGDPCIVVGARSAVFAPIKNLGIVIVDEEHDASYKESESPRYNGRDVAIKRGSVEKVPVLLGSATPSLESYYNATTGKYRLLEMVSRLDGKNLPKITVCLPDPEILISNGLQKEVQKRLKSQEQSLLFLNRRGSARFVLCRRCGFVFKCPNCSVSLVSHKLPTRLICHICDYSQKAIDECPECHCKDMLEGGFGTQRLERELTELFPNSRIARMDRDTTSKRGSSSKILAALSSGKIDILVGTQMITKGHDYPNITLVGILSVEDELYMPDFRSSERTFQQIIQAAGRSGRGDNPGKVILQTISGANHSVSAAIEGDYTRFYKEELRLRKEAGYPPFLRLARVTIESGSKQAGEMFIERLSRAIYSLSKKEDHISILGPSEAVIFKAKNRWRWKVLLKSESTVKLGVSLSGFIEMLDGLKIDNGGRVRLVIDVDPIDIM